MKTVAQLTDGDLAIYRETAQRRSIERSAQLAQRREHALGLAQEAAALLKAKFGATNVILFGSLVRKDAFSQVSDIDLAVEGIYSNDYFRAVVAGSSISHRLG